MQSELLMMNWALNDPPNYKGGHEQQQSIIKYNWYICGQALRNPLTHKLYRVVQISMNPNTVIIPSFSQSAPMASWEDP
jgi:hypothetical protein